MTNEHRDPLWDLLDRTQMDIRDSRKRLDELAAKLVQIRAIAANRTDLEPRPPTATCGCCGLGAGQHTVDCDLAPKEPA